MSIKSYGQTSLNKVTTPMDLSPCEKYHGNKAKSESVQFKDNKSRNNYSLSKCKMKRGSGRNLWKTDLISAAIASSAISKL